MNLQDVGVNHLKDNKHFYVAITGVSGSGKSTILQILKKQNAIVKDYDDFSVSIVRTSKTVHSKLCELIGNDIVEKGNVNLKRIGTFFEGRPDLECEFEKWYQPYLGKHIYCDMMQVNYKGVYFFDVPFLHEKNLYHLFDEIWEIKAEKKICCERIRKRNNYSFEKAKYLVERSSPLDESEAYKTYYIDNNGTFAELEKQVVDRFLKIKETFVC